MPRAIQSSSTQTAVQFRKCSRCPRIWAFSRKRPGCGRWTVLCPKCKAIRKRKPRRDPSQREIRERTAKIRESWSDEEYHKRHWTRRNQSDVQVVRLSQLIGGRG